MRQLSQWCGRLVWLASNAQSTGPLSHSFITVNAHQKHMRAYALVSLHHVIFRLFWTQISNADKIFLASFQVEIKRKPSSTNVTLQFDFQFFNDSQRHSSTLKLIICARGMWLSLSTTSLIFLSWLFSSQSNFVQHLGKVCYKGSTVKDFERVHNTIDFSLK